MRDETQHAVSAVDPRAETSRQGGQLSTQLPEGNAKRSDARVWTTTEKQPVIARQKREKLCLKQRHKRK
jgi:hypothetical protein